MIQFDALRLYTHIVDGVRFKTNPKEPFMLIYFSENSNFINDYPKLNLKLVDFKIVAVPQTKIPRVRLNSDLRKLYRQYNLYAYPAISKFPSGKNLILDLSQYLGALDQMYKPSNYRQRAGFLIRNIVNTSISSFPNNYRKVFLYSVDLTKDMNTFINRKSFSLLRDIKEENLVFDHMLLNTITPGSSRYRMIIKDKNINFQRIKYYLKSLKGVETAEEETEDEAEKASNFVVNKIEDQIDPENKSKIKDVVKDFLTKDTNSLEKTMTEPMSKTDAAGIATTSILYKLNNDASKSKRMVSNIPQDKKLKALKAVEKNYTDDLLKPEKTISISTDQRIEVYNTPTMVNNKSPEHIFQKRQIDFETNLRKDFINSFKVLEKKDVPLNFKSITISDKERETSELEPSDLSIIEVTLTDEFGNVHTIPIEIPKIDPSTGTFRLNGRKKCLVNQIIQKPITFPKPGESKFESSYSIFRIYTKKLRREEYLEAFMVYRLPLLILLSFGFGFEETLKMYDIKYEITKTKPSKKEMASKISLTDYIVFKGIDSEIKKQLCQSFIHGKVFMYETGEEFGTTKYFEKLIIEITGRLNSTYLITSSIQNIVDPVVKQILRTDQLPTDLHLIMKYMAEKVIDKFTISRNDISNQRVRGSEILVGLAQKQILAAHTVYKEQVLSGNKEAVFTIPPTKVINDFLNTELVTDMEYANPVEEMSTMTRVSPVGKKVLGIPDKRAIQKTSRNIHDSYFGNIDPLDTPESETIGIVQQLTIDAQLTSARGLIAQKKISNTENSGMLSTTTCLVPFLENNDGARVIMISNQCRQMLPLKNPEQPAVQSGYESILTNVLSDNFIKRSPCTGTIQKISTNSITVKCNTGKIQIVDISPVHLRSGSGKDSLSVFTPIVKEKQSVKKNDVIAEGGCMSNGSISLGRSLAIALMPYKGYNFEDGIVINEKLIEEDKLTSLHGVTEEIVISKKDRLMFIEKIGTVVKKGEPLLKKTIGELDELIGIEDDESIGISGQQYILKSPGGKIVGIDVFSNVKEDTFPELQDLIKKTNKKHSKKAAKKFTIKGQTIKGVLVRFEIQQELKIGLGDKLCNRYGNKGIISLVEKDENMPRTPFGDRVDIILNPVGLIGRMNMGQLYELYCGLIAKELGRRISGMTDKSKVVNLLKTVLPKLDTSKNKEYSTATLMNISKLNPAKFTSLLNEVKRTSFFPIIIPPFKAPSNKDIEAALKVMGLKSGYKLKLPEFNVTTKNEVPIGYMYISKLEHIGDIKIHGRSTGPVSGKTGQPTSGKRREGGQRLGELDSYCFISYNCPNLLAELMGPLSDDYVTKDEILSEIIQTGDAAYREPKISPGRDLLNSYFKSLMLDRD